MSVPVSVLIITLNEESTLPSCLSSVTWSDDVHILDSFSTDSTVQVATRYGASVSQRAFDGYASQRNFGLKSIEYKYRWLLILDADEVIPADLAAEILAVSEADDDTVVAYSIRRKDYLFGTWLKHVQASPYYLRLVRPERVSYEREVNEVLQPDGQTAILNCSFVHHPFAKGIAHWIAKHNVYSTMEAVEVLKIRTGSVDSTVLKAFTTRDFHERRFHQKALFYKLPFRPIVKFGLLYVLKGGFLDGGAGLAYATLQAMYEYMIVLKTRELELAK